MKACALALLLALPCVAQSDGGVDVARLKVGIVYVDGREREVADGCWMSSSRCLELAQERERLAAENGALRDGAAAPPWVAIVGAFIVGLAGGVTLTVLAVNKGKP